MLRLPMAVSALFITASTDTVWWNTDGGNVSQHRDGDRVTCSLTLDNDEGRFVFAWSTNLPPRVVVEHNNWTFPAGHMSNVALQIGDVWLDHGNGAPNIPSMTGTSEVMFILDQPIDGLLVSAQNIAVRTPETEFGMSLAPKRVKALVDALHKCSAFIGRQD